MTDRTSRVQTETAPPALHVRFAAFELDEANARLLREGAPVALAPTPFALLCALVRHPGTLLTKQVLLDEVWGHQFFSESVLKTAISDLRTVLDDDARQPRYIETVSRRGYRFVAQPTPVAAPTPAAGTRTSDVESSRAFVGRASALAQLQRAWDRACRGERAIVWVAGEPGIGKTTLVEHFIATLGDAWVVRGQCVEHYGAGEPYLPVLEALSELCRIDKDLPALLRSVAPTWLMQLPWLCTPEERDAYRRDLDSLGPERMLREMGEVLDRSSGRRPLLLVTEDLHWSDRATVQLIEYVARRRGPARFMWLATFRVAEVVALDHPLNRLRHELRMHRLCEEIPLDPFSEQEVADFVAQRSESLARDEGFVRELYQRTDGVPLFVASVMTEIAAKPASDDTVARPNPADVPVPESLAGLIDHYIDKLDTGQRAILSAAAVIGVEFRIGTLAEILERNAVDVATICDALARERLWLKAPSGADDGSAIQELPYAFNHALFRQILFARTPAAVRTDLHAKVASALERERNAGAPIPASELAVHFERGRRPMAALRYYVEAAEAALARGSPAECIELTDRALTALDHVPASAERDAIEIALWKARGVSLAHLAGIASVEARSAFQRAYTRLADMPEHPLRALVFHGLEFVHCQRSEYDDALAIAERAEALASQSNDQGLLVGACYIRGQALLLQGRPRASREWLERGLRAFASLDRAVEWTFVVDPHVHMLGLLAIAMLHLGLVVRARAKVREAYAVARGQPKRAMSELAATWLEGLMEIRLGNAERVRVIADAMQGIVEASGVAQARPAARWFAGWVEARLGEPRDGFRRIRDAFEENVRLGMTSGASETLGYAAEALLLARDFEGAGEQLRQAFEFVTTHGERIYLPQLYLLEGSIARQRGQSEAAEAAIRRALAEALEQEARWHELGARVELCDGEWASRQDRQALAELVARLPEAVDTIPYIKAQTLLRSSSRA